MLQKHYNVGGLGHPPMILAWGIGDFSAILMPIEHSTSLPTYYCTTITQFQSLWWGLDLGENFHVSTPCIKH